MYDRAKRYSDVHTFTASIVSDDYNGDDTIPSNVSDTYDDTVVGDYLYVGRAMTLWLAGLAIKRSEPKYIQFVSYNIIDQNRVIRTLMHQYLISLIEDIKGEEFSLGYQTVLHCLDSWIDIKSLPIAHPSEKLDGKTLDEFTRMINVLGPTNPRFSLITGRTSTDVEMMTEIYKHYDLLESINRTYGQKQIKEEV